MIERKTNIEKLRKLMLDNNITKVSVGYSSSISSTMTDDDIDIILKINRINANSVIKDLNDLIKATKTGNGITELFHVK